MKSTILPVKLRVIGREYAEDNDPKIKNDLLLDEKNIGAADEDLKDTDLSAMSSEEKAEAEAGEDAKADVCNDSDDECASAKAVFEPTNDQTDAIDDLSNDQIYNFDMKKIK